MPEIRCGAKLHGIVTENSIGILEKTCESRFCQIGNEVVLHRWNLEKISEDGTIRPIETLRLKRPK